VDHRGVLAASMSCRAISRRTSRRLGANNPGRAGVGIRQLADENWRSIHG
jgi:hypothetical protein